ncbi:MAG: hypothetical protein KAH32_03120 [Chlamydiia bacterium]|nr:hypothetical protein [Chlamydiia bacterium]
MTLNQLASTVRNHVNDGLNGLATLSFSIEQLKDEILLTSSTLLVEMAHQGLVDLSRISQRIDGVRVECEEVSRNCSVPTDTCAPHFTMPDVNRTIENPILFLGTIDSKISFKVYFDRDFRYHKYRLATSKAPFAWISSTAGSDGMYDVYLFNLGKYNNLQFLSIDAIFDNPYDLLKTDYYDQFASTEFYAPKYVQTKIIDSLTQKYVNYYRQLHMPMSPNTQQ